VKNMVSLYVMNDMMHISAKTVMNGVRNNVLISIVVTAKIDLRNHRRLYD